MTFRCQRMWFVDVCLCLLTKMWVIKMCALFSRSLHVQGLKWRCTRRKNQFYQQHQHTYTLISSAKRSFLDNKIKQWMETPFKNGTNQATHKNMNNFWQTDNQLVEIFLLQFVLNIVRDYLWSERHIQLFFLSALTTDCLSCDTSQWFPRAFCNFISVDVLYHFNYLWNEFGKVNWNAIQKSLSIDWILVDYNNI